MHIPPCWGSKWCIMHHLDLQYVFLCLSFFSLWFFIFQSAIATQCTHLYLPHPTSTMSRAQMMHQNLSFRPKVYFFAFLFFVYFLFSLLSLLCPLMSCVGKGLFYSIFIVFALLIGLKIEYAWIIQFFLTIILYLINMINYKTQITIQIDIVRIISVDYTCWLNWKLQYYTTG